VSVPTVPGEAEDHEAGDHEDDLSVLIPEEDGIESGWDDLLHFIVVRGFRLRGFRFAGV
jgi:hypothetical protein